LLIYSSVTNEATTPTKNYDGEVNFFRNFLWVQSLIDIGRENPPPTLRIHNKLRDSGREKGISRSIQFKRKDVVESTWTKFKTGEQSIMNDEAKQKTEKPGEGRERTLEIHFKSLKTNEKVSFKVDESATLESSWTTANSQLEETRQPGDMLRCEGGDDIMSHLQKSVDQIRHDKICTNLHFEIKGDSGGANA